ncbi:MAG TPA: MarC family protein [Verrucomicrobiota bacterium]|nr:MarC family protein [Verrucomicrobiota bacterium]HRZ36173.1 MarC family protein [Candidatus Paceibacterota bacterium]HRZ54150.1 MarC family protein [Candidatus Paceibacterota bacterium]
MIEFVLLAFSSLFVIVDPIAAVPAFLAMTPTDTPKQRIKMAGLACAVSAGMLIVFAWVGNYIFRFLGITMPAFQMAGSIVLLLVALDMLKAQRSRVHETSEETDAGTEKQDIAIAPLAVPMLAGPGAITTAILLHNQAGSSIGKQIALFFCILAVAGVSYVTLRLSAHGAKWLSPIVLRLITRIMGLLLVAIAFQFVFNALEAMKGKLL